MYQALYRKWRPRTFGDVVGQEHITETLRRQVEAGRLSHAYLFTGTRGTGKTTCAKILARAVNCEQPVNGNPCNCCPSCRGIENGSILDVLELDAASNNGVDQIRALREEAIYTPAAVRKRVYIVDEVHMLSTPAFNALLKILEEPPAHLMFVLATTELHKVPATIKSRCQQFAFKRIPTRVIASHLGHVAEQEGISLTGEAARLLSRLADGGLRDALSLLDQCSGGEGEVTEKRALEILGLAGNQRVAALLDCVASEDVSGALVELDQLYQDGKDMGALLSELSGLIRDLLIFKTAADGGSGLLTGGYEEPVLRRLSEAFTAAELVQMMEILQSAQADLYRSTNRRVDAELCLIRLCDRRLADDLSGLAARLSRLEEKGFQPAPPAVSDPSDRQKEKTAAFEARKSSEERIVPRKDPQDDLPPWETAPPPPRNDDLPPWESAPSPPREKAAEEPPVQEGSPATPGTVDPSVSPATGQNWAGYLAALKGNGDLPPGVFSFLQNPKAVTGTFGEDALTLWVDTEMTKGILSKKETVSRLEAAAEVYTGRKQRVLIKVGQPAPDEGENGQEDSFNDLLTLGRQFGNFTVK